MIFHVLACDYDGTLAQDSILGASTAEALGRAARSGRKLIMVSGRELPDLQKACDRLDLFDAVVLENGGLLYLPRVREERLLCEPASLPLADELRRRGVQPLSVGRTIIATWDPHGPDALDAIHSLGLEHQVIFNKGAVMILPPGVNKGTGLEHALRELGYSRHNTVAVGDAENDYALLSEAACGVAVFNALDSLKQRADMVTGADHGAGVIELIDRYLLNDMLPIASQLAKRHKIVLGTTDDGTDVTIPASRSGLLITGSSGAGKSTVTGVLIERLLDEGRSMLIIDPEGDYSALSESPDVILLGGASDQPLPSAEELQQLGMLPGVSVILDLHALTMAEKTLYGVSVLGTVKRLRAEHGRPHWLIIDEAHHIFPAEGAVTCDLLPIDFEGLCMITFDAGLLCRQALGMIDTVISRTLPELRTALRELSDGLPDGSPTDGRTDSIATMRRLDDDEAMLARLRESPPSLERFRPAERRTEHRRHVRKYATGELATEKSFFFRGPENRLNLRAANLIRFCELAAGVDAETWEYHLRQGEYAEWIRVRIGNADLAADIDAIAKRVDSRELEIDESRREVCAAIGRYYAT